MNSKVVRPGFMAGLGWFPFVSRWRHLRNTCFHKYVKSTDHREVKKFLISGLFKTGNQVPPDGVFLDFESFNAYLKRREHRGAMTVHDLIIKINGPHVAFHFDFLRGYARYGYTPFPLPCSQFWIRRFLPAWHGEGENGVAENPSVRIDPRRKLIIIKAAVKFRIGKRLRRTITWLTGSEPPYVWMKVVWLLDLNTFRGYARASGTVIPSQWIRWATTHGDVLQIAATDMLWADLDAVSVVLDCGPLPFTAPRHYTTPWKSASLV